ncbi:spidroin-1-like [Iris pallida]|uniref:Spidroin-1-like n=1 Tax=Iris pallida TaxID=29817 RepID=A0AAX6DT83_IRIPA|nr:spidroin-1-like [Iris pallida]
MYWHRLATGRLVLGDEQICTWRHRETCERRQLIGTAEQERVRTEVTKGRGLRRLGGVGRSGAWHEFPPNSQAVHSSTEPSGGSSAMEAKGSISGVRQWRGGAHDQAEGGTGELLSWLHRRSRHAGGGSTSTSMVAVMVRVSLPLSIVCDGGGDALCGGGTHGGYGRGDDGRNGKMVLVVVGWPLAVVRRRSGLLAAWPRAEEARLGFSDVVAVARHLDRSVLTAWMSRRVRHEDARPFSPGGFSGDGMVREVRVRVFFSVYFGLLVRSLRFLCLIRTQKLYYY